MDSCGTPSMEAALGGNRYRGCLEKAAEAVEDEKDERGDPGVDEVDAVAVACLSWEPDDPASAMNQEPDGAQLRDRKGGKIRRLLRQGLPPDAVARTHAENSSRDDGKASTSNTPEPSVPCTRGAGARGGSEGSRPCLVESASSRQQPAVADRRICAADALPPRTGGGPTA